MKILFTSYCQKRINLLSRVLSIGILFPIHYYICHVLAFSLPSIFSFPTEYTLKPTLDVWPLWLSLISYFCEIVFRFVMIRFKCIDLDGNGVLTRNELQFFYEEQLHRMECMAQEPVLFEDILCQIIDMVGPEVCLFFNWFFFMLLGSHSRWNMIC